MRRPVIFTPKLMVAWLEGAARARDMELDIELNYDEGQWAGAGEPLDVGGRLFGNGNHYSRSITVGYKGAAPALAGADFI